MELTSAQHRTLIVAAQKTLCWPSDLWYASNMRQHLIPASFAQEFGLSDTEAQRFAPVLEQHLTLATLRTTESERMARRRLLADTNASLAIEDLPLAEPELAFFHFMQQFRLAPSAASAIHHAYSLARARSVSALAAE